MKNPLTLREKRDLKDWANVQHVISHRYAGVDPIRSEFYHGRSVAAGKIAAQYNPIRHTSQGWFWGSKGPFPTRAKAVEVAQAVYASGWKGRNPRMDITDESKRVFEMYARDAGNWSGTPLVGGNVGGSKEERGNLTHLKRLGLIFTEVDEGNVWIYFTSKGVEYAKSLGINISQNPTLAIPIKSRKQLGHLFKAQSQLAKAGVVFDTGTQMKPMERHWELDWSLKGAKMKNPKRKCPRCGKYMELRFPVSMGPGYREWEDLFPSFYCKSCRKYYKYNGNPIKGKTTREEKAGQFLGGLGLLAIPILTVLILWIREQRK